MIESEQDGPPNEPAFLSVREVATCMGLSPKTIRGFIKQKRLHAHCFTLKQFSIARTELQRFLREEDTRDSGKPKRPGSRRKTKKPAVFPSPPEPEDPGSVASVVSLEPDPA